jgi:flagellar biosynthesis protein FliP
MLKLPAIPAQLKQAFLASHRRAASATGVALLACLLLGWSMAWGQSATPAPAAKPASASTPAAAANANKAPAAAEGAELKLPNISLKVGGGDGDAAGVIQIMLLFTLITLAPSILVMMTPFLRIVIVLGLLRNALGTQQTPPNTVLVGLALFLSLFIMMPVIQTINKDAIQPFLNENIGYADALGKAQQPLRTFMLAQTRDKDLALFVNMAKLDVDHVKVDEIPLHVVIPAFMISELKSSFQIGFVIYLPFLVVDMVVSSILMSMGMLMLPPVLISLPFKLLMFILSDGWNLIFGSLVRSFK